MPNTSVDDTDIVTELQLQDLLKTPTDFIPEEIDPDSLEAGDEIPAEDDDDDDDEDDDNDTDDNLSGADNTQVAVEDPTILPTND